MIGTNFVKDAKKKEKNENKKIKISVDLAGWKLHIFVVYKLFINSKLLITYWLFPFAEWSSALIYENYSCWISSIKKNNNNSQRLTGMKCIPRIIALMWFWKNIHLFFTCGHFFPLWKDAIPRVRRERKKKMLFHIVPFQIFWELLLYSIEKKYLPIEYWELYANN